MTRVKLSKKARATRSLLKVLRKRICMRTMIMMAFPKIPKTAIISLVKKSTHDANSSYSNFSGLSHSKSVTLFATILSTLDHQASLVLMLSDEEHSLDGHKIEFCGMSPSPASQLGRFEVKFHTSDRRCCRKKRRHLKVCVSRLSVLYQFHPCAIRVRRRTGQNNKQVEFE